MIDYEIHTTNPKVKLPWAGIGAKDIDDLRKKFIKTGYLDEYPEVTFVVWNGNRALGGMYNSRRYGYCWVRPTGKNLYAIDSSTGKIRRL